MVPDQRPPRSISLDDLAREKLKPETIRSLEKVEITLRLPGGEHVRVVMTKRVAKVILVSATAALGWAWNSHRVEPHDSPVEQCEEEVPLR